MGSGLALRYEEARITFVSRVEIMPDANATIFIIDDAPSARRGLTRLVRAAGFSPVPPLPRTVTEQQCRQHCRAPAFP